MSGWSKEVSLVQAVNGHPIKQRPQRGVPVHLVLRSLPCSRPLQAANIRASLAISPGDLQ